MPSNNKIRRFIVPSKDMIDYYSEVSPVVSSTGGFYNPSLGSYGQFYLDINGTPKSIEIRYDGNISIRQNSELPERCYVKNNKYNNNITILNLGIKEFETQLIFEFSGTIDYVKYVRINGWNRDTILCAVTEYDQTNIPMDKSETNMEDDTYIFQEYEETQQRELEPIDEYSSMQELGRDLRLPDDYTEYHAEVKFDDKGNPIKGISDFCKNCFYWKNNYCELWDAPVKGIGWCKSWKSKRRRV